MEHFGSQRYEKENQQHVHVPVLSSIVSWMRGPAPVSVTAPVAAPLHPPTPNPSASVAIAAAVPLPHSRAISRANSSTSVVSMGQSPMPNSSMQQPLGLPTRSPSQTMPRARSSSAVCELPSSSPGTPFMTPVGSPNPATTQSGRSHISLSPSLFSLMGPPTHHHVHGHRPVAFKL